MDETGFSIGSLESTRVIVDSTIRTHWQAHPGRQGWATVVECICADGTSIEALVIFRGQNVSSRWFPKSLENKWYFVATIKGWTSNLHGYHWLTEVFDPLTRDRAKGRTRILICDGHGSHLTGLFIEYCINNNIQLLVLPPHTSHMLQPLDVAIFGPLKKALTTALTPFYEAQVKRIRKKEWVEAYEQSRKSTFTARNIASAWRAAGLAPFDRMKPLRYLPSNEKQQIRDRSEAILPQPMVETTSRTPPRNSFQGLVLTSFSRAW